MAYLTGHRSLTRRAVLAGLLVGSASLTLATPASAYEVVISPTSPQLGDTLSVIIQANQPGGAPPTVTVNQGQQYPTFPLSGNRFRALIPTSPVQAAGTLTIQVVGDGGNRNLAVGLRNRTFPTQRITLSSSQNPAGTQYEFDRVATFKTLVTPERFWRGAMVRPNPGRVSTVYGVRRYYNGVFAQDYYHRGVDYSAPTGSPVVAPAAGRIALVGRVGQGFDLHGNTIGIDHGQGVLSIMIHLHRIDVSEGDFVQAGQVIGTVGSTGISTGPHLHWGLYVHGIAVDPVPWRERGFE
ncbi:MAG: M23 family metallopeptidase [Leptolyngbya sp.]|nr:M23 family metallopeptidase [Leptolyngbya sp.]